MIKSMNRNSKVNIGKKLHRDREEFLQFCSSHRKIHLYGMGYVANMIYEYLKEEQIAISDVIVGNGHKAKRHFKERYDVFELSQASIGAEDGIILCVRAELQTEIRVELRKLGIKDSQIYGQRIYSNNTLCEVRDVSYVMDKGDSSEGYFTQYVELDKLGEALGTDKCSKEHNYLNKYEFFLNKWKQEEVVVLELGVFHGASLNMWGKYFEKGSIYGVDIDPDCMKYEQMNCRVCIKDLGDEEVLEELRSLSPTIIIDDASHMWSHQIKALYHLLPALKSGGVFIMEDMGTSFSAYRYMNYDDAAVSAYDFLSAVSKVVNSGEFLKMDYLNPGLYPLKKEIEYLAAQVEMISFINESCILVKK